MNHDNSNIPDPMDRRIDLFLAGFNKQDNPGEEVDVARIKRMTMAKIRREEEADRLMRQRLLRRRFITWLSAAALVALIAGVAIWSLHSSPSSFVVSDADETVLARNGYNTLVVPAGKRSEITLSDGSLIIANSHTVVKYPDEFKGEERRVYVDGEVYCKIAKNPSRPFIVESEGFDVKVLGTTFNICNTSDSTASIVLVEGSVQLTTVANNTLRLRPDDIVDLSNGDIMSMRKVNTDEYTSWIHGLLYFNGVSLDSVISRVNRHYGLNIACDPGLASEKIYGKLELKEDPDDVIKSIRAIIPMEVERDGRNITLTPAS